MKPKEVEITLLNHNVWNSLSTLISMMVPLKHITVLSAHGVKDFVERLYACPMGNRILNCTRCTFASDWL